MSMVPKTAPTLYSIFNRNDPTPTAQAMRNVEWGFAKILVIGRDGYEGRHEGNLRRLVAWTTGSAQDYQEGDEWPDHLWESDWSWQPLPTDNIELVVLDEIDPGHISGIESGDIVDLTSGTKEQAGSLIRAIHHLGVDVDFVVQTRSGETLNLSTGEAVGSLNGLTFREQVWLSSGYIVDYAIAGDPAAAKIWSECSKNVKDGRISPNGDEVAEKLGLPEKINLNQGFWLEQTSADLMSAWPNISESFVGPRLIRPSFTRAAGPAYYQIKYGHQRGLKKVFKDILEEIEVDIGASIESLDPGADIDLHVLRGNAWAERLRNPSLTHDQRRIVMESMHSVEFDFIAFDSGEGTVFVGECKIGNPRQGVHERIHSLSKMVFPTNGVPLLVYSGLKSKVERGVRVISWPDLSDPDILGGPSGTLHEELESSLRDPSDPLMDLTGPSETGPAPVEEKSAEAEGDAIPSQDPMVQYEAIRETLLLCREEPRSYRDTMLLLKERGVLGRGLLNKITSLSKQLGFSVIAELRGPTTSPISGSGWLAWDDERNSAERRRREERKRRAEADAKKGIEEIRETLLLCKEEPRNYGEALRLLKGRGVRMKGVLKKMESLTKELGFSINFKYRENDGISRLGPVKGKEWLSWDEEE